MMAAVVIGPTQKPAAHFCGRVFGEAIHFDRNTTSDRTGQAKFELVLHRPQDGGLLRLTTTFRFVMRRLWPRASTSCRCGLQLVHCQSAGSQR
jgi:hypothetical protein